jgi:hypothetical protein
MYFVTKREEVFIEDGCVFVMEPELLQGDDGCPGSSLVLFPFDSGSSQKVAAKELNSPSCNSDKLS